MAKRKTMKTVADLIRWTPYLSDEQIAQLKAVAVPLRIGRKEAPQSLANISLEDLYQLEQMGAEKGVFFAIGSVLLGMTDKQTLKAPAMEMLGLRNMVVAEQERIAALFAQLDREPSAAEVLAGVDKLNFGLFGLADWYAQRMHITDHDEAFRTPWARIWQCRKNDLESQEYKERLQKAERQLSQAGANAR